MKYGVIAAIDDNINSKHQSRFEKLQEEFESKKQQLQTDSRLIKAVNQKLLLEEAMDCLAKRKAQAREVNIDIPPPNTEETNEIDNIVTTSNEPGSVYKTYFKDCLAERYNTLHKQGYPVILELSLKSVSLDGRMLGLDGNWVYTLCLTIQADRNTITDNPKVHAVLAMANCVVYVTLIAIYAMQLGEIGRRVIE